VAGVEVTAAPRAADRRGRPLIGVLAIQGDFEAHARMLGEVGAEARAVRTPADLEGLDALVIPGGESTTMTHGIERERLAEPLRELVWSGTPVLGTCAGMIVLDRDHLGLLDLRARRNAFGRQVYSFEADLDLPDVGEDGRTAEPFRAVFIRAPWVDDHGEDVQVLAEIDGHPVAVRQGDVLAVAFHPEIAGDRRLHEWLVARVRERESAREAERA
jgi:pyridoxal 5'-phosphate synthase pdxT subunit